MRKERGALVTADYGFTAAACVEADTVGSAGAAWVDTEDSGGRCT